MRRAIIIFAICLFLVGPVAKISHWQNEDRYILASGIGLLLITAMAFVKQKENKTD